MSYLRDKNKLSPVPTKLKKNSSDAFVLHYTKSRVRGILTEFWAAVNQLRYFSHVLHIAARVLENSNKNSSFSIFSQYIFLWKVKWILIHVQ